MAAESIGLLFRIKGDSSDAVAAVKDVKQESAELDTTSANLSSTFKDVAVAGAVVGAGMVALGAIALNVGKQIFALSKSAAEFGEQIYNVKQVTGLGAETISSLKFAAEESGSSLDEITDGLKEFAKTVKEAADGSDKAREKLKAIGVTSTDLERALAQALATIVKVPPGIQQMAAAEAAFGEEGVKLLPFIKSFDGDLVKLTAKAKSLGLTLTDDGAAAANQFADQMKLLSAQVDAAGRVIGFAFMPIFLDMATQVSGWLVKNQGELEMWSSRIARVFQNAIRGLQEVIDFVSNNSGKIRVVLAILTLGASEAARSAALAFGALVEEDFQTFRNQQASRPKESGNTVVGIGDTDSDADKKAADRRRQEREAEFKKELANLDKGIRLKLQAERNAFQEAQEMNEKLFFDRTKTEKLFAEDSLANIKAYSQNVQRLIREAYQLDLQQAKTETERQNAKLQGNLALQALNREIQREAKDAVEATIKQTKELAAEQKKAADEQRKVWNEQDEWSERQVRWQIELREMERQRMQDWLDFFENMPDVPLIMPGDSPVVEETIFDKWTGSFKNFYDAVMEMGPNLSGMLNDIANIGTEAFQGFAQALGSVVEQWVLTGETGPAVMRKILASALAAIAAESAVRAIFELAKGFAALFLNPAEAAAHFTAAALFGSIAVGAALVGRAVAPKNEGSNAFGGATSDGNSSRQDPQTLTRTTGNPNASGNIFQRTEAHIIASMNAVAQSVRGLDNKIGSVSSGEVLIRGMAQRPGAVTERVINDIGRNAGYGTRILRGTGQR